MESESAIIVWNAGTRTQHFIRRASFRTKSTDIGFLVPTPALPELAEADGAAFELVDKLSEPDNLQKAMSYRPVSAPASAPSAVVVVTTAKVGGYDAAVLDATNANALDAWLKANGYASDPALLEWYRPYIEKRWMITAFKLANDGPRPTRIDSKAVRMSFGAEQPIFPYREPERAGSPEGRSLLVYFLGDTRVEARTGGTQWAASSWSKTLTSSQGQELGGLLKLTPAQTGPMTRLTVFSDSAPSRAKDDLVFQAAASQSDLPHPRQSEINEILRTEAAREEHQRDDMLRLGGPVLVLLAIAYYVHWRRRPRKA